MTEVKTGTFTFQVSKSIGNGIGIGTAWYPIDTKIRSTAHHQFYIIPSLFHVLLLQPARAACSPLSSSRACRHWFGMMSSAVETIEPSSPVSVSSHTLRSSE